MIWPQYDQYRPQQTAGRRTGSSHHDLVYPVTCWLAVLETEGLQVVSRIRGCFGAGLVPGGIAIGWDDFGEFGATLPGN